MDDAKKISTEYQKEKSDKNIGSRSRNSDDGLKRLILIVFLMACAIPILLCIYLMMRLNSMERRLDDISIKLGAKGQSTYYSEELQTSTENIMELEQAAYDDLEINTDTEHPQLTLSEGSDTWGGATGSVTEVLTTQESIDEIATGEAMTGVNDKIQKNGKKVYLTFDDGPSIYTGEILDILEANDVKATFFVVYNNDEKVLPYYKQIVEEGHTLGMHSYTHDYGTIYASQEAFEKDITKIHDFLYEETGVDCTVYRFPGGSSNSVSSVDIQDLMEYLYSEGITYYDWNSLSGDAVDMSLSSDELNANIMEYVRSNTGDSIVLMHDLKNNHETVEGLQDLIDTLKREGYEICPIDDSTVPVQHVTYIYEE